MTILLGAFLLLQASTGVNFFSLKQDIEIGSEASKEAEQTLPLVRDMSLNRYFYSIGQRLTRDVSLKDLRYRFRIVNSKEINSFGFPGGAIYVDRGLIEAASNEDELAAILAHEVGHVASRHGTAQLSRQLLVQAPISIAAGLPTTSAWKDQLTKLGISFGVDASFLRYSRDQEIEANLIALRLLAASRFNPHAMATLLEKIHGYSTGEGVRLPAFDFNHPQSESLSAEIAGETDRLSSSPQQQVNTPAEFRTFHAALQKVAYPAEDKDTPDPAPSDAISSVFRHPQDFYQLGYPTGWQVTRTGPNGAIIAPVDGVQSSRVGDDITHGVMFDLFESDVPDRALTLEQATNRLIVFLRQRNQSLRIVPGAQVQMLVSDEPGLRTVMIGQSGATNSAEVVWVVTRAYYQNLFYMVFVAPEDEFPTFEPVFEQMIRSARLR
jgi:Zn-dependent protease with chaperone function